MAVMAIAAGALVATVLPSSADVSAQSPPVAAVRIESPATLVARGAAVATQVTVVCQPGAPGFLGVEVTENAGGKIAKGFGSTNITCTGGFQTITVNVVAEPTIPFRAGTAFGDAFLSLPGVSVEDQRVFTIARPQSRLA
jgi:hypothetical protein